ncbi:MAG: hypothetical protein JXR86_05930 [Spirochaetales bacterium]|nr:hypothetical protein [Spirochaetales bacterium]
MIDKYKMELKEILDELVVVNPSLYALTGPTELFNWRSIFDFSSVAWEVFPEEYRLTLLKSLAEKESLFIALMTYKKLYLEMGRPDIANAAGFSLARFLESLFLPDYEDVLKNPSLMISG